MTNLSTGKRGDIHPITGKVFWSRDKSCVGGVRWVTREEYLAVRQKAKNQNAAWYERNQETHRVKAAKWFQENKHKVTAYQSRPLVRLARNIRCKCNRFIRSGVCKPPLIETLGCSPQQFRDWLESTFQPGMTWANYGEWEMDHIIPFNEALTESDVYWMAFYKNTRALWRKQNRKKHTNI